MYDTVPEILRDFKVNVKLTIVTDEVVIVTTETNEVYLFLFDEEIGKYVYVPKYDKKIDKRTLLNDTCNTILGFLLYGN